jgi:hypothetical protein
VTCWPRRAIWPARAARPRRRRCKPSAMRPCCRGHHPRRAQRAVAGARAGRAKHAAPGHGRAGAIASCDGRAGGRIRAAGADGGPGVRRHLSRGSRWLRSKPPSWWPRRAAWT